MASAEDVPGSARTVTNWLIDSQGYNRVRPGVTNATFDPTNNRNTSGAAQNIIGTYIWTNPVDRYDYLIYVRADRMIFAKNLTTLVNTALSLSTDITTQLDGNAPRATFAEDGVRVLIAGGGQIQTWTGVIGVNSSRLASFVLGTNQPPLACTHVMKLANYIIANNQYPGSLNQYIWSGLGDGNDASWPPLNFNTADARPDPVVAVYENLRELYAFGTQTIQVYGVGADSALPFTSTSTLDLGTTAPYSIIRLDQQFAMLDYRRRFVLMDGRSYQTISTPIDKTIRDITTVGDCFGFRCQIGWWDLLVWVFPSVKNAYYYEMNQQKWGLWRGWNGVDDFAGIRIGSYVYWPTGNLHLVGDSLYENIFTLDNNADVEINTDATLTLPIVAERITKRIDWETTVRKRCNSVRLFLRRGTSLGAASAVELSKSDDGGPWSQPTTINLGTQTGDTQNWADWYPGGIYRRRQYRIRYSGAADMVLSAMEEDYSELSS